MSTIISKDPMTTAAAAVPGWSAGLHVHVVHPDEEFDGLEGWTVNGPGGRATVLAADPNEGRILTLENWTSIEIVEDNLLDVKVGDLVTAVAPAPWHGHGYADWVVGKTGVLVQINQREPDDDRLITYSVDFGNTGDEWGGRREVLGLRKARPGETTAGTFESGTVSYERFNGGDDVTRGLTTAVNGGEFRDGRFHGVGAEPRPVAEPVSQINYGRMVEEIQQRERDLVAKVLDVAAREGYTDLAGRLLDEAGFRRTKTFHVEATVRVRFDFEVEPDDIALDLNTDTGPQEVRRRVVAALAAQGVVVAHSQTDPISVTQR